MKIKTLFGIALSCVLLYDNNSLKVNAQNSSTVDLRQINCRELFRMTGQDREDTLTFFHGVVNGKNDQMIIDVEILSEVTDKVIDHCIDNPNDSLLSVFEQYTIKP